MVIGEGGKVKTNIRANRVIVSGTVIGNVEANEEVRLQQSGKILGNIKTPNLLIQSGVMAKGDFEITGKKSGNIQKLIEDEYTSGKVIELDSGHKKKA
jgi:cytoskeletal protein CcmA (bactofilin family)